MRFSKDSLYGEVHFKSLESRLKYLEMESVAIRLSIYSIFDSLNETV